MINSILVTLVAHIMSIYLIPYKVLKRISSTILKFYWGGTSHAKPIYWKSRDILERRKAEGGLGLRNLSILNKALLFRQVWRISKNPTTMVSRVISHRYGGDPSTIARREEKLRHASWAMRSMISCARTLKSGCGMKEEIWAGKEPVTLRNRANGSHSEKPKFVSDIIEGRSWNANKILNLFERGSAQRILSTYLPYEEKEDEIVWLQEENGKYSDKSGYWHTQSQRKMKCTNSKFWKRLWKMPMSQRWRNFCWKLAHNILPTKDNLLKRKYFEENLELLELGNSHLGHPSAGSKHKV
ncbi:hypothetical protein RDABS01_038348 [Bienertia sinuspersici]